MGGIWNRSRKVTMIAEETLVIGGAQEPEGPPSAQGLEHAISRSQARFVREQQDDGYWWYELESNVTITAEYLMLFRFLGIPDLSREKIGRAHV